MPSRGLPKVDDPEIAAATSRLGEALQQFRPEALTAERVAQLASLVFPDRLGSAVWVNLKTGAPDVGVTIEVFKKDKIGLDALIGKASFGAALGYDVARRGPLVVSVFGGAVHNWVGTMLRDWSPAAGLRIRL